MNDFSSFEQLIRARAFLGRPSATGFERTKCPVCHDYKDRGGFKFEAGKIGYSCFNCQFKVIHDETSNKVSANFRKLLKAFGSSDEDINSVTATKFLTKEETEITLKSLTKKKQSVFLREIELPAEAKKLNPTQPVDSLEHLAVEYLQQRRALRPDLSFYVVKEGKLARRLLIPCYYRDKLIFWTARALDSFEKLRYISCSAPSSAVMFGMDELYRNTSLPLLVFEGIFDAIPFNGIALLGSKLSESKLELLKNAKRRLIFVVDRDKTGTLLGEAAINAGFEVSFIPSGFRDANEALVKTGAPWVVYNIMKSIPPSTTEALLRLKLNLLSPNGTK